MSRNKKLWVVVSATLLAGTIIGLVIAANFNWTASGIAESRPKVALGSADQPLAENFDALSTSKAFVEVAKRVTPTVVSITSAKVIRVRNPFADFFRDPRWGGNRRDEGQEFRQEGLGSGVIISADGYILTNNHVIQEAEEISVLIDTREYAAKIIGTDPKTDVAVIKIDAKNLPVIALGNSDELEVGEWVLAIGNPFSLRLAHTVTAGIVSGMGRARVGVGDIVYEDFIQTDAAINPGNSGGALVNVRGELVGINTAIVSGGQGGGNVGVGFAIPISLARDIMQSLIEQGRVIRGWLGVRIQTVDEQLAKAFGLPKAAGALVTEVFGASPAQEAGLQVEDIVTEFDGTTIRDSNHLMNLVASYKPGTRVPITLLRHGKVARVTVKLGERPEEEPTRLANTPAAENQLGLRVATLTPALAQEYNVDPDLTGVLVIDVSAGSQAAKEGVRRGDLIREVDRQPVKTADEFRRAVANAKGDVVLLRLLSGAERRNFFVALRKEN